MDLGDLVGWRGIFGDWGHGLVNNSPWGEGGGGAPNPLPANITRWNSVTPCDIVIIRWLNCHSHYAKCCILLEICYLILAYECPIQKLGSLWTFSRGIRGVNLAGQIAKREAFASPLWSVGRSFAPRARPPARLPSPPFQEPGAWLPTAYWPLPQSAPCARPWQAADRPVGRE